MIKKILLGIVIVIAAFLIFVATRPDSYTVVRSINIKAPTEVVYALIDDFHKWDAWSPWEKMDPTMKRTYSGSANGKGAIYEWNGAAAVGNGRMEITDVSPPTKLALNLDFMAPMEGHNKVEFALAPNGDTTSVTWTMRGENNYLSKLFQVFASMESMVGGDFDSGLAAMKAAAEKNAASASTTPVTQ
jgi:uncharacterized protein YndB with AHSA1/START domain